MIIFMLCVFYQIKEKSIQVTEKVLKGFPLTYIENHYRMDISIGFSHSEPQLTHSSTIQSETGRWTVPLRLMGNLPALHL